MARKVDELRQKNQLRQRLLQSGAQFEQQFNDYLVDEEQEDVAAKLGILVEGEEDKPYDEETMRRIREAVGVVRRAEVAPPPPSQGAETDENPDSIVDILTFCEHDYYLGLRLTPWQGLILKTFYMGTPGNYHLKINDVRPDQGCDGCVWTKNLENEIAHARARDDKNFKTRLRVEGAENSKCLSCVRFNDELRKQRYVDLLNKARFSEAETKQVNEWTEREITDHFQTEMDVICGKKNGVDVEEGDKINPIVSQQILDKRGRKFQELVLVLGRRSGKSFLVSIVALYEAYKFIMMGHPQSRYPLKQWDEIMILNVALSEKQAKGAIFNKLREDVLASPFFNAHVGKVTQTDMYLLTPADKEENKRRERIGTPLLTGSIHIKSGNSNSASQLGGTIACIIIDEMAAMARETADGGSTDDELYTLLKPSIATFGFDGKIICISNPLGPFGKFYELYNTGIEDKLTLVHQLPTWMSNPSVPREFIESERLKDPIGFRMQYAAQFGGGGEEAWLEQNYVLQAMPIDSPDTKRRRAESGQPLIRYYMHLDPAYNSDNYTLCILHAEPILGAQNPDGTPMTKIVVDHLHYWKAYSKNQPINVEEVEKYVFDVGRRFHVAKITYDQHWGSQGSIVKFTRAGFRCEMTAFVFQYQNLIYQELFNLFTSNRIEFYHIDSVARVRQKDGTYKEENIKEISQCRNEFLQLQKKFRNGKPKIEAPSGYKDDFCDCVAGAAYQALKDKDFKGLARPRLARFTMPNMGRAAPTWY